jgi:hypothetical protein
VTAEAVEVTPAEVFDPSAGDEYLARWLEASAAADKWHRWANAAKVAQAIPALEESQEKAAQVMNDAWTAKKGPEQALAALDAEIADAEADRTRWEAKHTDYSLSREERGVARFQLAEAEADIARLTKRREFAEAGLLPLRANWVKAKAAYEQATGAAKGREMNADPELAYYGAGQEADTYPLRFGLALERILRDSGHYEHAAAIKHMLHLCRVSGFRTENYAAELPSDAEQAKRFWDSVYEGAQHAEPVPTGREVIEAAHREMTVIAENKRLDQAPAVLDDRRGARPVPAPPQRSYMQYESPLRPASGR